MGNKHHLAIRSCHFPFQPSLQRNLGTYLAEGRKRHFGGGRRGGGGAREASLHGRVHHRLIETPTGEGSHEVGAPPAGVLQGRGGSQEERERRDSGAGRDHAVAAPGQEAARRRRMRRASIVRHCGRRQPREKWYGRRRVEGGLQSRETMTPARGFCAVRVSRGPSHSASGRQRWVRNDASALGATWSVFSWKIFRMKQFFFSLP